MLHPQMRRLLRNGNGMRRCFRAASLLSTTNRQSQQTQFPPENLYSVSPYAFPQHHCCGFFDNNTKQKRLLSNTTKNDNQSSINRTKDNNGGECHRQQQHHILEIHSSDKKDKDGKYKKAVTAYILDDVSSASWKKVAIKKTNDGNILNEYNERARIDKEASSSSIMNSVVESVKGYVILYFLPANYPNSVAPGYGQFVTLCFLSSVCGSCAMVLSTQTLLLAVGVVGSATSTTEASIMAGALNWVLKDGIGQLGGVYFASYITRFSGMNHFDANPKRWRIISALSLDGATLLEITSPLVTSSLVLPVACIANVGKNIGFLTSSASRAALHQSLSTSNNLADVTAKATSQSLVASLAGTTMGVVLSSTILSGDVYNYILGFVVLSLLHQGCNYGSLKAVPLLNLNRHRLHIILEHYVKNLNKQSTSGSTAPTQENDEMTPGSLNEGERTILTPSEVGKNENFIPFTMYPDESHKWLCIGSKLKTICPGGQDELQHLQETYCRRRNHYHNTSNDNDGEEKEYEKYLINHIDNKIHVTFFDDATGEDLIRGMYHAYKSNHVKTEMTSKKDITHKDTAESTSSNKHNASVVNNSIAITTHESYEKEISALIDGLKQNGFQCGTDYVSVESSGSYRLSFKD